jgi:hypothetical protein
MISNGSNRITSKEQEQEKFDVQPKRWTGLESKPAGQLSHVEQMINKIKKISDF